LDLRRGLGDHDLGHAVGRHRGQRGQDRAAAEGLFFAANSIVQKCVSGLGVFVSGLLLSVVHFPKGADPSTIDPAVVTHLVLVYAPTLVVLYGVGMACLLGYRITRAQHAENV
jgi:GPH family glycoside/pentoside/hexuronide:cation symporter